MFEKLKKHLFPHEGNSYKPYIFTAESIAAVIGLLAILQIAYIANVAMIRHSDFFASVLPAALISLANTDRASNGLDEVIYDPILAQAAQLKANDMAKKGYFSHISPDGKQPWAWLDLLSYPYKRAGENLAIDFSESRDVEQAWMKSPTHRANLLKDKFTHVGIATASGQYKGKDTIFVVQFFAQKAGSPRKQLLAVKQNSQIQNNKIKKPLKDSDTKTNNIVNMADENLPEQESELLQKKQIEEKATSRVLGAETFAKIDITEERIIRNVELKIKNKQTLKIEKDDEVKKEILEAKTLVKNMNISDTVSPVAGIITSPSYIFIPIFVIIFAVLVIVLAIAILIHIRTQYVEALEGGALLVFVAGAFLYVQLYTADIVKVPTDTQSAAVIRSLD